MRKANQHFDIVIVGGGLVAMSLALALRNTPLQLAIIEAVPEQQRRQNDFDARSLALSYGSQRICETLGLWDFCRDKATAICDIHVSNRGHFGISRFKAADKGLPALGYIVEFNQLLEALQQANQTQSNLTWFCPSTLTALTTDTNELTIEFENKKIRIRADLIVAADGANSSVRKLLDWPTETIDYQQTAIVANIALARHHEHVAYERFTAKGSLALLPMSNQRSALVWALPVSMAKQLLLASETDFLHALQQAFGYRLGRFMKVGRRVSFPLSQVKAKRLYQPGIVLLGNAAHALHPIAAQGFNLSLRDVAALAEILAQSPSQIASPNLLERFATWRQADQVRVMRITHGVVQTFANQFLPISLLRNMGLLALDRIPLIQTLFVKQMLGRSGRLSNLACGINL